MVNALGTLVEKISPTYTQKKNNQKEFKPDFNHIENHHEEVS